MAFVGEVWRLYSSEQLLGDLEVREADFPWLRGRFVPVAAFEAVRPLFDEELRLLDLLDEDAEAWEATYRRVEAAVTLAAPDGRRVPGFLLHISGEDAWWRWSDEPFDDV